MGLQGATGPTGATGASSVTSGPTGSPDTVSIASGVSYSHGTFLLTGTASSPAGVKSVEISAKVDGVTTDLGAATVNAGGTFTFKDQVGAHTQGFITATETDAMGGNASGVADYSLSGGLNLSGGFKASQTRYTADGKTDVAMDLFKPSGSQDATLSGGGQSFTSAAFDTFNNGGTPDSTFVFDPGHGLDVVNLFRVGGADHDTLSFTGSDFNNSVAAVLHNTHDTSAGAVITDPTSGDTVRLTGITKAQLTHNQSDFTFHG